MTITKSFLNISGKNFPLDKKLHRLFNRTNVKISCSVMPYMNYFTYIHNHKVLNGKPNEPEIDNCNCCNKDNCSLENCCQKKYDLSSRHRWIQAETNHLGSCEATCRDRFGSHKKLFSHIKHKKYTELSRASLGG